MKATFRVVVNDLQAAAAARRCREFAHARSNGYYAGGARSLSATSPIPGSCRAAVDAHKAITIWLLMGMVLFYTACAASHTIFNARCVDDVLRRVAQPLKKPVRLHMASAVREPRAEARGGHTSNRGFENALFTPTRMGRRWCIWPAPTIARRKARDEEEGTPADLQRAHKF